MANSEQTNQMDKVTEMRETVDTLRADKDRLTGSIEEQEKSLAVAEKECREKFGCEPEELDKLATKLEKEADASIKEAEAILAGSE